MKKLWDEYRMTSDYLMKCMTCKSRYAQGLQDCPECAQNSNSPTRREELLQQKAKLLVKEESNDTYIH